MQPFKLRPVEPAAGDLHDLQENEAWLFAIWALLPQLISRYGWCCRARGGPWWKKKINVEHVSRLARSCAFEMNDKSAQNISASSVGGGSVLLLWPNPLGGGGGRMVSLDSDRRFSPGSEKSELRMGSPT